MTAKLTPKKGGRVLKKEGFDIGKKDISMTSHKLNVCIKYKMAAINQALNNNYYIVQYSLLRM